MIEKNNEEAERALRKELRENTFSTKRSVIIAFLLVILFMFLGIIFDGFETKIFRNIFLALMFINFGYFGVSFIATLGYVLLDKKDAQIPAKMTEKKSKLLRVGETKLWKFFIIREFIDERK